MSYGQMITQKLRRVPVWALYVLAPMPVLWLFWQGLDGQLGPDPVKTIEHQLGLWALQLLLLGLAITPLRRFAKISLLKFRRAIGLIAFGYVSLHLTVWLVLDVQILDDIWRDILKRPYITIGMSAFALMVPLALTSNNISLRRLGRHWSKLHRLTYVAVLLGALHYLMLVKGFQLTPIIYLSITLSLIILRLPAPTKTWHKLRLSVNFSKQRT